MGRGQGWVAGRAPLSRIGAAEGVPPMQLTIPPSPAHLREVPSEVAEEVVLAVDETPTNAIL